MNATHLQPSQEMKELLELIAESQKNFGVAHPVSNVDINNLIEKLFAKSRLLAESCTIYKTTHDIYKKSVEAKKNGLELSYLELNALYEKCKTTWENSSEAGTIKSAYEFCKDIAGLSFQPEKITQIHKLFVTELHIVR